MDDEDLEDGEPATDVDDGDPGDAGADGPAAETRVDGLGAPGPAGEGTYLVVRRAVHDALWEVVGRLGRLLGFGLLVLVGLPMVVVGFGSRMGTGGWVLFGLGLLLVVVGLIGFVRTARPGRSN